LDLNGGIAVDFSVVISVYSGDDVEHFTDAMNSILHQTLTPHEVILGIDGPISDNMEYVIQNFQNKNPILKLVRSDKNIGRGGIKHLAISSTTTNLIAIMDADDISVNNRFEVQAEMFAKNDFDLVGGYISEFSDKVDRRSSIREVPLEHENIIEKGKWIQPYNHVTVMFKKSTYIASGGYGKLRMVEDYDLFFRMAMNGAVFCNVPKILVYVRTPDDQYLRRHGTEYFKEEFALIVRMLRLGYINHWVFVHSVAIRLVARTMPVILLRFFTQHFLRGK